MNLETTIAELVRLLKLIRLAFFVLKFQNVGKDKNSLSLEICHMGLSGSLMETSGLVTI